ncbi:MAG TPA: FHA domain-containing protein [Planctomycetota bacterium]|nr:FHA domain-containing protein [Planctomycetota bacterium]
MRQEPESAPDPGPEAAAVRRLVFLGTSGAPLLLRNEGEVIAAGHILLLVRRRSPWSLHRDTERVIAGTHPSRADVLLAGEGIHPEHIRIYFSRVPGSAADLLAIHPGSTRVNGLPVEPREWTRLLGGEELSLGPWRFRYEAAAGS